MEKEKLEGCAGEAAKENADQVQLEAIIERAARRIAPLIPITYYSGTSEFAAKFEKVVAKIGDILRSELRAGGALHTTQPRICENCGLALAPTETAEQCRAIFGCRCGKDYQHEIGARVYWTKSCA